MYSMKVSKCCLVTSFLREKLPQVHRKVEIRPCFGDLWNVLNVWNMIIGPFRPGGYESGPMSLTDPYPRAPMISAARSPPAPFLDDLSYIAEECVCSQELAGKQGDGSQGPQVCVHLAETAP